MYLDNAPGSSPFDLRFSVFRIPVTVTPMFWFVALLFCWRPDSPIHTLLAVLCLFLAVLVHELGHAVFMSWFGASPVVVLHQCGGFAAYDAIRRFRPWQSLLTTAAGPGVGLLLGGSLIAAHILGKAYGGDGYNDFLHNTLPDQALYFILWASILINIYLSLFNLIPVYPLDGGQIMRHILEMVIGRRALRVTRQASVLFGVIAAAFLYKYMGSEFGALLIAVLTVANIQHLSERTDEH